MEHVAIGGPSSSGMGLEYTVSLVYSLRDLEPASARFALSLPTRYGLSTTLAFKGMFRAPHARLRDSRASKTATLQ